MKWTPNEIKLLKENYSHFSNKELRKQYFPYRSIYTICRKGLRLGYRKEKLIITLVCQRCGKKYIPTYKYQKNCSYRCRGLSQRNRINVKCLQCGKEFWTHPSSIKEGESKFCSLKCSGLSRRVSLEHKKEVACRCIKNYQRKQLALKQGCDTWEEWQEVKQIRKYARRYIPHPRIIKRKTFICLYCGKEFQDKWHHKRKYCSPRCANEGQRLTGGNRGNVGKRAGNGGIEAKTFWKMKMEYGFRCAICGGTEPFTNQYWPFLTQDHWNPKHNGGRKRSKENIVPMCWDCNTAKKYMSIPNEPKPLPIKLLSAPQYKIQNNIQELKVEQLTK